MDLQGINIKFFAADANGLAPTDFIHVFNSWVQASNGEYYDIADYSHVHAGPGVLLIAHEANISMDYTGNRLGLLYNRKQPLGGGNIEKLEFVFETALEFCHLIENEPAFKERIRFRGNEALFLINDRLLAPNTKESLRALRPDLEKLAGKLYGGAPFSLDHDPDPKRRFSVSIKTPGAFEVDALLENLGSSRGRLAEVSAI